MQPVSKKMLRVDRPFSRDKGVGKGTRVTTRCLLQLDLNHLVQRVNGRAVAAVFETVQSVVRPFDETRANHFEMGR